ncbi:MAG: pimeloyl-ACP methyl ester carboxylesterase/ubiquinone/menaquinone biosynthesis C-methylase UbiE [Bacillariaceae sp.]|jgi:pimeloyl-ACP methyl ester carboxylesterase/ubiquinone/menaquinone biosynthesis C-methylase UbiE
MMNSIRNSFSRIHYQRYLVGIQKNDDAVRLHGYRRLIRSFCSTTTSTTNNKTSNNVLEKIVSANGIDFQVTIRNPDAPYPLLCLPGALGTGSSDFSNLLYDNESVGDDFSVIALDMRGLGGSQYRSNTEKDLVHRDYPTNFYIRDALDAAKVMQALGHERYSLLGWSDGANSAVHLAAHPDTKAAVTNMILFGGGSYVSQDDVKAWESLRDINSWSKTHRDKKAKIHGGLERLQQLNNDATDGWISIFQDSETNGDICLAALHQVDCPTLVLHGKRDVICEMKHATYIARQIPDATLTVFPDGKHNIHQRYATIFHELVGEFLEQTMAGSCRITLSTPTTVGSEDENSDKNDDQPAIDDIAYGFMGSKALSVALKIGVFDAIDVVSNKGEDNAVEGGATLEQILTHCKVPKERLRTLLSACVALKLINRRVLCGEDVFSLPKASADQLVKSSKRYWGDYIVGQVDAQFYTRMKDLDTTILTGDTSSDGYETWFDKDPDAAKRYTQAQHNGSLATGYGLLKRLPELSQGEKYPNLRMLDIGGGSGAFSVATARKVKDANCVILDLPNVIKVAEEIISKEDEQVRNRLSTVALSAADPGNWMIEDESFDVVLMSYVSGSIPSDALSGLYQNAFRALRPGGMVVIHDFFVDNNGEGPKNAALWALTHVTVNPEGMGLRPGRIVKLLTENGLISPKVEDMIPGTTQLIVATKPKLA